MMAITGASLPRLARFSLCSVDAVRLASFYMQALGFHQLACTRLAGDEVMPMYGVKGGALKITLGLGREVVELLQFDQPGRLYPSEAMSSDLTFQHFAIVVADMSEAFRQLSASADWTAISSAGPQHLPPTSGGVVAFKFRDPEGHPLELLAFPPDRLPAVWSNHGTDGPCLGIDHSAISVADSARSIAFYRSLGFRVIARSLNHDPAQSRLDGLPDSQLEVTALAIDHATPHLELLCYRAEPSHSRPTLRGNDIAATRMILDVPIHSSVARGNAMPCELSDPDGHRLSIMPAAA